MCYEWEKHLSSYVPQPKIEELRELVKLKAKKGRNLKWALVAADVVFIGLLLLLIGIMNLLKLNPDPRFALINGIIAFKLAAIVFFLPLRPASSKIMMEEVDHILGKMIPGDIFKKISQSVDKKASGVQKWLAFVGPCGVLAALIIKTFII